MLLLPAQIDEVAIGDRLLEPVYDHDGRLLLNAGAIVCPSALMRLKEVGVVRLLVEPHDAEHGVKRYAENNQLARCERCGSGLALQPPRGQRSCRPFRCAACEEIYFGEFDGECTGAYCGPERVFCDRSTCDHICEVHLSVHELIAEYRSPRLAEISREIAAASYSGAERRRAQRHRLELSVIVVPLSESYRVTQKPRLAHTHDISASGVSVVSGRPFNSAAVVVDFQPAGFSELRLIANVVWEAKRGPTWQLGAAICGRVDPSVGELAGLSPPSTAVIDD